jgi:hypothetical protein
MLTGGLQNLLLEGVNRTEKAVTEREQLQYLCRILDELDTAAQSVRRGHFYERSLPDYITRKVRQAMGTVPYPGELPDELWEEETRPDDTRKGKIGRRRNAGDEE